jgi:hypothetical protein
VRLPTGWDLDDAGVVVTGAAVFALAFLPWYESPGGVISLRGWGLGFSGVVVAVLAVYAAGRVVMLRGKPQKPDVPITPQGETFAAAAAALLLMAYRVLVAPAAGTERTLFLTLAAGASLLQTIFAARKLGRTGLRAGG